MTRIALAAAAIPVMAALPAIVFLPEILSAFVPAFVASRGVALEAFSVRSVGARTSELGDLRACVVVQPHRICLEADSANVTYDWSLARRSWTVESIEFRETSIAIDSSAGVDEPSEEASKLLPVLPLERLPVKLISFVRSTPVDTALLEPGRTAVDGSIGGDAATATLHVTLRERGEDVWHLDGSSSDAVPLEVSLSRGDKRFAALSVKSVTWNEGTIELEAPVRLGASDGAIARLLDSAAGSALKAGWRFDGKTLIVDAEGSRAFTPVDVLSSKANSIAGTATLALDPEKMPLISESWRAEVRRAELSVGTTDRKNPAFGVSGSVSFDGRFKVEAAVTERRTEVRGDVSADISEDLGSGTITFSARPGKLPLDPFQLPFFPTGQATIASGTVRAEGNASWGAGARPPALSVTTEDVSGSFLILSGTGVSGTLAILPVGASAAPFKAETFTALLEMKNLTASLGLRRVGTEVHLAASGARGEILGGTVEVTDAVLGGKEFLVPVELKDLDLAEIVALHKQEYIEASGKIDAHLPVRITPAGGAIEQLTANAVGPGWIKYYGGANGGGMAAFVQQALRDYQFTVLTAKGSFEPGGTLVIDTHLEGRSPGLNSTRPVHVNLSITQNVLALARSFRIADEIEQNLQDLW